MTTLSRQTPSDKALRASTAMLEMLWELCREVIFYANQIDRTLLSDSDSTELEAIERITIGYSISVQEIQSAEADKYPTPIELRRFSNVVQSHCFRALTALQSTLNHQNGNNAPITLLE